MQALAGWVIATPYTPPTQSTLVTPNSGAELLAKVVAVGESEDTPYGGIVHTPIKVDDIIWLSGVGIVRLLHEGTPLLAVKSVDVVAILPNTTP